MIENDVFFTIIIPCYNVEKHIEKCLQSIYRQDFYSVEILIIDDCSVDKTIEKIKKIESECNVINVEVIANDFNMGVSYSRNRGIELAKGKFILFLDADDYYHDNTLKTLHKAIKASPDTDIVSFSLCREGGEGKVYKSYSKPKWDCKVFTGIEFTKKFLSKKIHQSICSVAIKSELLSNYSIRFSKDVSLGEDIAFQLKCMSCAKKIIYLAKDLFFYNYNPDSVTNRMYGEKHLSCIRNYDDVKEFLDKYRISSLNSYLTFYYQYMFFYELKHFSKSASTQVLNLYLKQDKLLDEKSCLIFNKSWIILAALKVVYKLNKQYLIKLFKR